MPAFFHNRLLMLVLMLGLGLGFVSAVYAETPPAKVEVLNPQHNQAAAPPAARTETAPAPVRAELLEKLQDRLTELDKETAVLKAELGARVDAQDKLISVGIGEFGAQVTELSNQTTQLGNYISYTSLALVVIGLVTGVFAFRRAKQIAKEESAQWFAENDDKLRKEIDQLADKASQACDTIDLHREGVANIAKEAKSDIEKVIASVKFENVFSADGVSVVTQQSMQTLEDKPRAEWIADDFRLKARDLFEKKDYINALEALTILVHLLESSDSPAEQVTLAKALLNKGTTLNLLNYHNDASLVWERLTNEFSSSTDPYILAVVANAKVKKGFLLDELNDPEGAIAQFDQVEDSFGQYSELEIQKQLALALCGKVITLSKLDSRLEEANVALSKMLFQFEYLADDDIRKIIETARKVLAQHGIEPK